MDGALAYDLPGHGVRSGPVPLTVAAMAEGVIANVAGPLDLVGLVGQHPVGAGWLGWKVRSWRLLVTTKTELKAMAAPEISGLRKPSAASGRAAML